MEKKKKISKTFNFFVQMIYREIQNYICTKRHDSQFNGFWNNYNAVGIAVKIYWVWFKAYDVLMGFGFSRNRVYLLCT